MILKHLLLGLCTLFMMNGCKPAPAQAQPAKAQQPFSVTAQSLDLDNASLLYAFQHKKSGLQVQGSGVVVKLLADDHKGARHQRFLVKVNTAQTLLFAHNIDIAPKVPLQAGDAVLFSGEYVYNPKGGVVHWTHHAKDGSHAPGWLLLDGKKYQ